MSAFPPKPGTVAYRVLAHLEAMRSMRPRVTAGMVAGDLRGVTAIQVREALEEAHQQGYVNREAEISIGGRGPVFYELVRDTRGEWIGPGPGSDQPDRLITGTGRPDLEPRGVIAPVVDPIPPAVPADAATLPGHAGAQPISKVVDIRPRSDGFELEIERTPELAEWLRRPMPPLFADPPDDAAADSGAAAPVTLGLDFAAGTDQFAVALASDGRIHCWRGSVPFVFSRAEARCLVDYLNRIDLAPILEDAP